MTTPATPAIEGWFTTGPEPALLGSRCTTCATVFFPPLSGSEAEGSEVRGFCRNPGCDGETFETASLSRRGRIWSYTDARYQPPPPYLAPTDPYEPFAIAAVELAEGLVVLGQVADGFGVADLRVGADAELVVETLYVDETGERTVWRWRPIAPEATAR